MLAAGFRFRNPAAILFPYFFLFIIITKTPSSIAKTPVHISADKCSWNTVSPIMRAVIGSKDPSMAAFVEPISLIDIVIVSIEIIVGNSANPRLSNHCEGVVNICKSWQKCKL